MTKAHLGLIAVIVALSAATAAAQPVPEERPGKSQMPADIIEPPASTETKKPGTESGGDQPPSSLSEELKEGEGVITPAPGMSPDMTKSPPKDFKSDMPVIAPPGEPGGDQSVQPK